MKFGPKETKELNQYLQTGRNRTRQFLTTQLVDDLEPGSLKDELLKDFDSSQETYEEYLQRKSLERPFNMADGGMLVKPGFGGVRQGYSGEYGPNIRKSTKTGSFEVQVVRGGTAGGKGGQKFYKTFNFDKYGGEEKALKAAKEYRDSIPKIKKDTGKQSKGQPVGFKKQTGGQAAIRKALNNIIEVGGKSFSNEDLRKLVDMDLFPDDDQFRKAVDVVKKEPAFKNLIFEKAPRPRLSDDPVSVLQAETRKRRSKKLDLLGSKDYEKELYKFKKEVQEGLGLEPVKTTGAISGKPRKFLPIDMGHQSSIDQLKLLKQKLKPEDLGPQFYRANREGIRKFEGGVRTLEDNLKKKFYPEQKKLYNQAKKFVDAGQEIPADLQNKIINSNEKIQIFIDDTVKKYPLLKDRVNAVTIDANDLTVRRGGNVFKQLGIGLVDQDLGKIKTGSLDDLTIKANLAEQTLKEATDAGLIDKNIGRQRLDKFLSGAGKVLKGVGKVVKPIGYAMGPYAVASATAKADDMGIDLNLMDKIKAFDSGDADVAIDSYKRRTDPEFAAQERAKDLAQMTDDFEEVGQQPMNIDLTMPKAFSNGGYTEDAYSFLKGMQDDIYNQYKYYRSLGGKKKFGPYAREAMRKYFSIGGLSGGDKSGPPPERGPNPQGLLSLMKRGMKI
jgi:hypothetical protein